MTVKELIKKLLDYNMEAEVKVIANRITARQTDVSLNDIIKEYYSFEN